MWPVLVRALMGVILLSGVLLSEERISDDTRVILPTTIPDNDYEQVIAQRYLYAPFGGESTAWPVLTDIRTVWQVASLPRYHIQADHAFWLLTETMNSKRHMSWMSLSDNSTSIVLSDIDVGSFLVVSHNKNTAMNYTAALVSLERVQFISCDQSNGTLCRLTKSIPFPSTPRKIMKITAGLFVEDLGTAGWLYIATDIGLHGLDLSTFSITPFINEINASVSSLAWSEKHQTIFIGTAMKLWIYSYRPSEKEWRFEYITGLIDTPITSLAYSSGQDKLWIGQETGITLASPVAMLNGQTHWFFSRLAGQIASPGSEIGHLPFGNITTLDVSHSASPDTRVWMGSIYGVMRFNPNDTENNNWRVFNSARYMPNRNSTVHVSSLAVLSRAVSASSTLGSAAIAVTSKGLAVIRFEMWTLAQKAKHFQDFFNQTGRHDKYNLVSSCGMSSWGDSRTCLKESDDNDGLWTSMYLSSQIFRYVVTRDAAVRSAAWTHFEALELLNRVTGISGYPGRSLAKRTDFPPDPAWHPSPLNATLQFKGDTSSDEIVGHEYVYPLVHDLLATSDDERRRAYALVFNITNHILTHDWYLVGEKHTHTSWGIWNPAQLNDDYHFLDDRAVNSLEILAYLIQIYAYSGDERFFDGAKLLISSYRYDINLINMRMIAVCDVNFSDDELIYLSYFNFVYAINSVTSSTVLSIEQKKNVQPLIDQLLQYMRIGLDLIHKYKQMDKSPFYNFIYCYASGQVNQTRHLFSNDRLSSPEFDCSSLSKNGVWYLQRWPLELIDWPQFNSARLDVQLNIPAECDVKISSLVMLPPDERTANIWNYNVYDLDDGSGFSEADPTSFLISYWGMRYFDLLG